MIEKLKEVLFFDEEKGTFFWRKRLSNRAIEGTVAGSPDSKGTIRIQVFGEKYAMHRLAYMFTKGEIPDGYHIDHINGDPNDNRPCNLRLATPAQNQQNFRHAMSSNKTGLLGVAFKKSTGRYSAQIKIGGKAKHLGYFDDPEEAHKTYVEAKRKLHEFCTI